MAQRGFPAPEGAGDSDSGRGSPRGASSAQPGEDKENLELEVELEQDLYNNAFISCLNLPDTSQSSRQHSSSRWELSIPVLLMMLIAIVQLVSIVSVQMHIDSTMIGSQVNYMYMAYEMFLGTNATMPIGLSQKLCGEYEEMEMQVSSDERITLPDGTSYRPSAAMPMWYSYKVPTDSWDIPRMSGGEMSLLDEMLYMIHDGLIPSFNRRIGTCYSQLFLFMIFIMFCSVIIEIRKIFAFASMLHSFTTLGHLSTARDERLEASGGKESKGEAEKLTIVRLNSEAVAVGSLAICLRATIALRMMYVGARLLINTTLQLDLIFNSLALAFIFELDSIAHLAIVRQSKISFISQIEPIRFQPVVPQFLSGAPSRRLPAFWIILALVAAVACRINQIHEMESRLNIVQTLCLFVGPTPGGRKDVLAPAAGLCESLLSTTCAPDVQGPGSSHGPCLTTDYGAFYKPSIALPVDGELFDDMYASDGSVKPWLQWGPPRKELLRTNMWVQGPYQDAARKICSLMYQPTGVVDNRTTDKDTGEQADGAPFYCEKRRVMDAIFGKPAIMFSGDKLAKPSAEELLSSVAFVVRTESRWYDVGKLSRNTAAALDTCRPQHKDIRAVNSGLLPSKAELRGGSGSGRYFLGQREELSLAGSFSKADAGAAVARSRKRSNAMPHLTFTAVAPQDHRDA